MTADRAAAAGTDAYDVRRALRATGSLRDFNAAGVLTSADVHVAARLGVLGGEHDDRVLLAAGLAVRAVRLGSVCVDLERVRTTAVGDPEVAADADGDVPRDVDALPWPDEQEWLAVCAASSIVAAESDAASAAPLRLVGGLLYLERYWQHERDIRDALDGRAAQPPPPVDDDRLRGALDRLVPGDAPDLQRLAAAAAALGWVTVVAGGPGTGKTTTVARLLALLHDCAGPAPRIALAAPTGKAAARLEEAVREAAQDLGPGDAAVVGTASASTLHRLLGWRPDSRSRFRHDRTNRLPYDVVVVDETSMVSLTMMARLLDALRADTRLVLVGDPDQLASVEAGAVLGDLVERPVAAIAARAARLAAMLPDDVAGSDGSLATGVVRLRRNFRFEGTIGALADAVRRGDADAAVHVLRRGDGAAELVETDPARAAGLRDDVVRTGAAVVHAARAGDVPAALAALDEHRLLCAHRQGPYGVARWSAEVGRWLAAAIDGYADAGEWHVGRPLLVDTNDYELRLFNGDTGVVVVDTRSPDTTPPDTAPPVTAPHATQAHRVVVAFGRGADPVLVHPARLSGVQTLHAMTVHRGQGSQFSRVSLVLPPADSPLLTRELLYTAVTRARTAVRVLGGAQAVRAAVERPVVRASGLRRAPHAAQGAASSPVLRG